jgi:FtsP/CotA-like multicopper oxidase with cupredoxin domain
MRNAEVRGIAAGALAGSMAAWAACGIAAGSCGGATNEKLALALPGDELVQRPHSTSPGEFFGNMIMVNGDTWPFHTVEQRRYRLRFLNGCQSRCLILELGNIPGVEVWQIGNEGGFLAAPVDLTAANRNRLLLGLAERADLIVTSPASRSATLCWATSASTSRSAAGSRRATSMPPIPTAPARSCSSGAMSAVAADRPPRPSSSSCRP